MNICININTFIFPYGLLHDVYFMLFVTIMKTYSYGSLKPLCYASHEYFLVNSVEMMACTLHNYIIVLHREENMNETISLLGE